MIPGKGELLSGIFPLISGLPNFLPINKLQLNMAVASKKDSITE